MNEKVEIIQRQYSDGNISKTDHDKSVGLLREFIKTPEAMTEDKLVCLRNLLEKTEAVKEKIQAIEFHYAAGNISKSEYERGKKLTRKLSVTEFLTNSEAQCLENLLRKMGDINKAHAEELEIFARQRKAGIKRPVKMHMHLPDE